MCVPWPSETEENVVFVEINGVFQENTRFWKINQADFSSQETCNWLEALILLQDSVRKVNDFLAAPPNSKNDFLGFAASRFSTLLPTLNRKSLQFDIPVVVWACARIKLYHEKLLVSVAERLKSSRDLKTLPGWGLCALLWSYDVLDPDTRFAEFKNALESERVSLLSGSESGFLGAFSICHR